MASPYQQQAFQRKLIYLFSIIALFTGSWLWRHYVVEVRAAPLGVLESSRGDVDLPGKFLQLSLTGMRGMVTAALWMTVNENQRKNQWNELDQNVHTLTKLQPHFIRPWLFQAWNLSYNVSVSLDRTSDKYFYIARGQQLLAEGERQNRDNPELRWALGFTYQHKITMHDETNVLRSLLQLSMIPPNERDPNRFLVYGDGGTTTINWAEFEDFCKKHPQLVRRLHSGIQRGDTLRDTQRPFRCTTANSVVQFLKDNYKVVSIYETPPPAAPNQWVRKEEEDRRLPDETERFPVLPPRPGQPERPTPSRSDANAIHSGTDFNDGHDSYALARAWFAYSMDPVPPPGDLPGENGRVTDRIHQRVPKNMATSIFRQSGPRAASYMADRMEQEGWFDKEPWAIPDWFKERTTPFEVKSTDVPGVLLAEQLWNDAYKLWQHHGIENHLIFDNEADLQNKKDDAAKFRKWSGLDAGAMPPNLRKEDLPESERDKIWEWYNAARFMHAYETHTRITNILHHYHRASVEKDSKVVEARKLFYEADTKRIRASPDEALERYLRPEAIAAFVKVLLRPEHKDVLNDSLIQEEMAEIELKYLDLLNEAVKPSFQSATQGGWGLPLALRLKPEHFPGHIIVKSPFVDAKGESIITRQARETAEQRRAKPGAKPAPKAEVAPPGPQGQPLPPGPGRPQ
jgi:hypothetical protein